MFSNCSILDRNKRIFNLFQSNVKDYMRQIFTIIFFVFCSLSVFSQQGIQSSLYMQNKFSYNPAYAGLDNSLSLTGMFRKQWVNLEGSPTTQNLNAHMPFYYLKGGIGINIDNDILGAQRNTRIRIAYSYQVALNKSSLLTFGIAGGATQQALDGNLLRAPEGDYVEGSNLFNHNDDFIPIGIEQAIAPTLSAGIYFQNERFEIGLAVHDILESDFQYNLEEITAIQLKRNYFLNFGTSFDITSSFELLPSLLLKSDIKQTQIEFSTLLRYNGNIFGGATFRGYNATSVDAIAILAGIKLNEKITLSYAYDLTLSTLRSVSQGSHEIMINYNLNKPIGKGIPPKVIYNPRFL